MRAITGTDKDILLNRLPTLKLSYDTTHNKVSSELYYLIPSGPKHLLWYTYFEDKRVCILAELKHGSQGIKNVFIVPQIFEKMLVLGTIMCGTLINIQNKKFFSIENIHFYKGKNIEHTTEMYKLELIKTMLTSEIKQATLTNNGVCIGLPIIVGDLDTAVKTIASLPYSIYSIQNRNLQSNQHTYNSILYKNLEAPTHTCVFAIKADIQNDVYHLYVTNNSRQLEKYDIAAIPNYKTSVLMNGIFRKIKENKRLDALEESDDEDEFENIREDKFVDLDKCVHMECVYNSMLKKYVPIGISKNVNVVSKQQLYNKR